MFLKLDIRRAPAFVGFNSRYFGYFHFRKAYRPGGGSEGEQIERQKRTRRGSIRPRRDQENNWRSVLIFSVYDPMAEREEIMRH